VEANFCEYCAPGRIRTADHLVRSRKDDLIGS
jgi:aerobic-type carbon monoxide dehydrogenase small subunit (CoxS/CutS family)